MVNNKQLEINSKEYWDERFESGEWETNKGREQTFFHYEILLKYLPDWLKTEIKENKMSICDLGSGMGDGVKLLKDQFPLTNVTGIDFSKYAIEKAKKTYTELNFINADIEEFNKNYDVIILSHTLEHFENPTELLNKMIKLADKYFIIVVPFKEEDLYREHLKTFDYNFFPLNIANHELIHYKEIGREFYEAGNYFAKEQILVIYANTLNINSSKFSLEQLNNQYFEEYNSKTKELQTHLDYYKANSECLQKNYNKAISEIEKINNDSLKIKNELEKIFNTRPYRLAYLIRRFSLEFRKGNWEEKKNFIKWIYLKLLRKDSDIEHTYNPLFEIIRRE
jgi:SAM-dependent methyltransferase